LLVIFYFLFKIYQSKSRLKRETKDLKEKFEKEYNELESDIKRELGELKRIRGKREATQEEKKREEELLKNLADIKSVFEKELKDIV
jgi:Skp family chaperone for outer membrane proteins